MLELTFTLVKTDPQMHKGMNYNNKQLTLENSSITLDQTDLKNCLLKNARKESELSSVKSKFQELEISKVS